MIPDAKRLCVGQIALCGGWIECEDRHAIDIKMATRGRVSIHAHRHVMKSAIAQIRARGTKIINAPAFGYLAAKLSIYQMKSITRRRRVIRGVTFIYNRLDTVGGDRCNGPDPC